MDELTKQKANDLVLEFQETGDNQTFSELYDTCKSYIEMISKKFNREWGIEVEEFQSEGYLTLFRLSEKYEPFKGDFMNLLMRSLRNQFLKVARVKKYELDMQAYYLETDEGEVELTELNDCDSVTMDSSSLKDMDESFARRDLLETALSKAPEHIKETASLYLEHGSFTQVGEILGITSMGVKKRIQSLQKYLPYSSLDNLMEV